jgi:Flp pilus assembly protein TadD
MTRLALLVVSLLAGTSPPLQSSGFTLQGRITTDKSVSSLRVVLEDPKSRNAVVGTTEPDEDGTYEFRGLVGRDYRLVTIINGKRQDRRDVEILCRSNSTVSKDFHYGRSASTLMLHFPAEDPDFIDVAELQGNYSKDVLRDYEKAFQDHINGNAPRAIERLEAIVARAPEFYGAHARLGIVYQQEGCFFDAEAEYTQASALSSRSLQPLVNLASVQIRAADLRDQRDIMIGRALDTLKKALEIRPASALSYCLMGAANAKIRSFDEAEKNLQRALDLDGDLAAARLLLADVYLQQKNWAAATENLKTYLEDFPFARDRSVVKQMIEDAQRSAREDGQD